MTIRDDILRVLRASPRGMTDAELAARLRKQRQQVNQRCRQLAAEGIVVRDDSSGVIVNRVADPSAGPAVPAPALDRVRVAASAGTLVDARAEWSWEGNVQAAVVSHLARQGWRVTRVADTSSRERGVDVVAERDGETLLVEVKGWPSRVYVRGERAGQPKPTQPSLQAKHWYAEALLAALRLREKHPEHAVAIAFPDLTRYRRLAADTRSSLTACRVEAWFVSETGEVAREGDGEPQ